MFLHGMQGRLIRFCRPFMPGVEKHTDSLTEIAVKTHFASQGFIDSGYITCRIFITLPFQYAYVNPEKPDVPLNKNDAFQKVQKRRVQEKR